MGKKNDNAAGCGCLFGLVLLVGALFQSCGGEPTSQPTETPSQAQVTTSPTPVPPLHVVDSPSPGIVDSPDVDVYAPVDPPDARSDEPKPQYEPERNSSDDDSSNDDSGSSSAYYANCSQARAAGAAPIYAGEPGYRLALDRNRDGVACE